MSSIKHPVQAYTQESDRFELEFESSWIRVRGLAQADASWNRFSLSQFKLNLYSIFYTLSLKISRSVSSLNSVLYVYLSSELLLKIVA